MQSVLSDLRAVETEIERIRIDQSAKGETLGQIQGRYYEAGAQVTRIEQNIAHTRELRQRQQLRSAAIGKPVVGTDGDRSAGPRVQLGELSAQLEVAHAGSGNSPRARARRVSGA